MKKLRLKNKAFTVLESLLVLMISAFLLFSFSLSFENTLHVIKGELFVARFEQAYKDTQLQASALVEVRTFSVSNGILKAGDEKIEIPEEVLVSDFAIKFNKQGNNSSLKKITIYLPNQSKKITYQLEMGSGKYKKKIQ
ncbi:MAG: competence type IV pilus minor pilin ComGD [Lactovum sp.]